jgi:hypothetical protein
MGRAEDALGRLLPWPLLPPAAALVDVPPPFAGLALLPLPIGCLPCGASAIPRARQDALDPFAMDTLSNRVPWSSARGESGAAAHLPLSGLVALLLLEQQRHIAVRLLMGLLRGLLGRSHFFGAPRRHAALCTRVTGAPPSRRRPNPAEVTQLCSETVTRSPTHRSLLYDHLPAAANSAEGVTPRTPLSPFRRAGFAHVTQGGG